MEIIYQGFDGLDLSVSSNIPHDLADRLERAQEEARKTKEPALLDHRSVTLKVAETGAPGGYAFRCEIDGAIWFFKRPNPNDPWGVRVSLRSMTLALYGLGGARQGLFDTLESLGIPVAVHGVSIGRVDYAIDFLAPGFVLEADHFVTHSRTRRKDHFDGMQGYGTSNGRQSLTIGSMPGKQIIVYDKRADVIAKNKREWWEIWNAGRRKAGKPELDRHDRDGAQIWRVELRAGKHHLKEDWGIRSFADLDARLGDLYGRMMQSIRYTVPSPDTHRNRWPVHPLWHMATEAMAGDLFEMVSHADPERVKQVAREAQAEMLAAQGFGLSISHAHMLGYGPNDFLDYLDRRRDELTAAARENPAALEDRFAKAERRYVFI